MLSAQLPQVEPDFEEYSNWITSSPHLYDYMCINRGLEGVPGSLQWIPQTHAEGTFAKRHQLQFVATPTTVSRAPLPPRTLASADEQNEELSERSMVQRVTTLLPLPTTTLDARQGVSQTTYGTVRPVWTTYADAFVRIKQEAPLQEAPIIFTRVVAAPNQPEKLVAAQLFDSDLYFFSVDDQAAEASGCSGTVAREQSAALEPTKTQRLCGHRSGTGSTALDWNTRQPELVLSAGHDGQVLVWDITSAPCVPDAASSKLAPHLSFSHPGASSLASRDLVWHTAQWNVGNAFQFATGGERSCISVWDTRLPVEEAATHQLTGATTHGEGSGGAGAIMTLDFGSGMYLATGGHNQAASVWDLRYPDLPVCHFVEAHRRPEHVDSCLVTCVRWNPHDDTILASAGADRQIRIWDINARANGERSTRGETVGASNEEEEEEEEDDEDKDGDEPNEPGLIFTHAGHRSLVTDLAWNPTEPWTLASIAQDRQLHIWQISGDIVYGGQADDDGDDGDDDSGEEAEEDGENVNDNETNSDATGSIAEAVAEEE